MKATRELLQKLNQISEYILSNFPKYRECNEDNDSLIFSDEAIDELIDEEADIGEIELFHPDEYNDVSVDVDDYLRLDGEIQNLIIENSGLIKTPKTRYYIVSANDSDENYLISDIADNTELRLDGVRVKLISKPLIITIIETNTEFYNPEYDFHYSVIELQYESTETARSSDEEIKIINSFIFEIADTTGIALNYSDFENPIYNFYALRDKLEEDLNSELRELIEYNEGMQLFISATQIKDQQMKFLNFYKILEFFAPIAASIEAKELMRKKLDVTKNKLSDGDYIDSIFELANSIRAKLNDEDLIKTSIDTCTDIIGLFDLLPISLKDKILKQLRLSKISYNINQQNKTTIVNMLGKSIYKTRNKVVHAKSNYTNSDNEIKYSEFNELNNFMRKASSQAIRWYSRLPSHIKSNKL